ncbi:MAG: bifunctional diaminohydroxyphosphoribosylaminopyrimidine deaminase/5-amino-6-(5-phosphoribosylamino)uracil reductase RibD, partial [Candidatus Weimeria sp.]
MRDTDYMRRAIELARRGEGGVNPNPLVGAVIVKDGVILGEGAHLKYGSLHAERNAIKDAKENGNDIKGATIYVTLEPCCHHGHQPPCTEAIVEEGIKKVVIGSRD